MLGTRRFPILLATILAVLALLAAACGGDDDDGGDDNGGEPTATKAADSNGDGATEEPTEEGDEGSDDEGGDGEEDTAAVLDRFRAAAASLESETFYAVYEMKGTGIDGAFTLASDPPNSLIGIRGAFDGEEGTLLMITTEEFFYFCSDSGGEKSCIKMKGDNTSAFPLPTLIDAGAIVGAAASAPGADVNKVGGEKIAGIDADCYEFSSASDSGKVCIGDDLLLLLEGTFDGQQITMRASEITTDPGKVEMEVPDWPVTDLTGLSN